MIFPVKINYDRLSISPDKPGWFANSDKSQFIRVEQKDGHKEYVILDEKGPGALVRFWITTFKRAGKHDLEMLGWADGEADCAATTYWYGLR